MIMDKEQLEKIEKEAEEYAFARAPKRGLHWVALKQAHMSGSISGYNYHKQESEGLREEVD